MGATVGLCESRCTSCADNVTTEYQPHQALPGTQWAPPPCPRMLFTTSPALAPPTHLRRSGARSDAHSGRLPRGPLPVPHSRQRAGSASKSAASGKLGKRGAPAFCLPAPQTRTHVVNMHRQCNVTMPITASSLDHRLFAFSIRTPCAPTLSSSIFTTSGAEWKHAIIKGVWPASSRVQVLV